VGFFKDIEKNVAKEAKEIFSIHSLTFAQAPLSIPFSAVAFGFAFFSFQKQLSNVASI
jgi:hypothetical protein